MAVSSKAIITPPPTKPTRSGLERCTAVFAGKTRLSSKPIPIKARKTSAGNNCLRKVVVNIAFLSEPG